MNTWRVYGSDTVACRLAKAELAGFFRKRMTVGPGESAAIVKNGQVDKIVAGGRETVSGWGDRIASFFGQGTETNVVFFDNGPISFSLFAGAQKSSASSIGGSAGITHGGSIEMREEVSAADLTLSLMTADHLEVDAMCNFTVTPDPQQAGGLLKLMSKHDALACWDLAAYVKNSMLANVLVPEVAAVQSAELRGNRELAARIESTVREKLAGPLSQIGFVLNGFSITWGTTEAEQAEIEKRQAEIEDDLIEFAHQREVREMAREKEVEKQRLENLQELKTAEAQGDNELATLLLAGEINRDQMLQKHQVDVARVDAEIQMIQFDVDNREAQLQLEQHKQRQLLDLDRQEKEQRLRLQEAEADSKRDMDEMEQMVALKNKMSAEKHLNQMATRRQEIEAEFQRQQIDLQHRQQERQTKLQEDLARMGMMERLMAQGLSTGAANSDVLKAMLQESTKQGYATTSDDKVAAVYGAEASKNNMGAYQQAEDRERQHQTHMTGLSAGMMQASKQTPSNVVVPGQPHYPAGQVNLHVAPPQPPPPSQAASAACPFCSQPVQSGWKACPFCGTGLGSPKCGACGGELQTGWKACPACGSAV